MILLLLACERCCELEAELTPGCGVQHDGVELRLGDSPTDLAELGATERAAGDTTFFHLGQVSGWHDGEAITTLTVADGFAGATDRGLALGSTKSDVQAQLGAPGEDPLTRAWVYADQAFQFEGDEVVEITLHASP